MPIPVFFKMTILPSNFCLTMLYFETCCWQYHQLKQPELQGGGDTVAGRELSCLWILLWLNAMTKTTWGGMHLFPLTAYSLSWREARVGTLGRNWSRGQEGTLFTVAHVSLSLPRGSPIHGQVGSPIPTTQTHLHANLMETLRFPLPRWP